jgi:hypothetical protein
MKQNEEEEFKKKYKFKPEIHVNTIKKDNKMKTEEIVVNPFSYCSFVKKSCEIRRKKFEEEKSTEKVPGSGKNWQNKMTVPESFRFGKSRNKSFDLKSVSKSKVIKVIKYI